MKDWLQDVRFVHRFMNCVPSLKNSLGKSAISYDAHQPDCSQLSQLRCAPYLHLVGHIGGIVWLVRFDT